MPTRRTLPTPRRARAIRQVPGAETRQRLLDCAEALFADRGFRDVSLREVVSTAGVNVAAANYHFGTKEDLFEHVFDRCAKLFAEDWLANMSEAAKLAGRPDYLEGLLLALITPNFMSSNGETHRLRNFNRLRVHIFGENREFATRMMSKTFAPLVKEMTGLFADALPALSSTDLAWRIHVMLSSLVFTSMPGAQVHAQTAYQPHDGKEAIHYLVPLLTEVFRAPAITR